MGAKVDGAPRRIATPLGRDVGGVNDLEGPMAISVGDLKPSKV